MSRNNAGSNVFLADLMNDNDSADEFIQQSKVKRFASYIAGVIGVSIAVAFLMVPVGATVAIAGNAGVDYWDGLESVLEAAENPLPQRTILLDKNGKEFAQFYSENRQNIALDSVDPLFVKALLATEDSRFYENNGFDSVALARSFFSTASGGQKQGASGITQQLVKNIQILNAETEEDLAKVNSRVISTKVQEIKYAVYLEEKYTKEEILEMYLNTVYFGNRAYGLHAAAQTYFSTTPDKLTLSQIATLVGVVNNPTIYDPINAPEGSEARKNMVLGRLLTVGDIDQATYDKEVAAPVELKPGTTMNGCGQSAYPYYCELVRQEILNNEAFGESREVREKTLERGGLTITTAMDPNAMNIAREEVSAAYEDTNRVGSAIATVEPGTGRITAIAQNRSWGNGEGKTEVIYATSKRQTGSSFKAFTLATAMEQGIPVTSKMNSNSYYTPPAGFTAPDGGFSNFGFYNYGMVDGYQATKMSMNVWFVRMMERTGVIPVAELANRLGLSIPTEGEGAVNPATLSLTLGAWESSPIEMANAYATFAASGVKCNPVSIVSAVDTKTGEPVKVSDPDCHQEIMPNIANTVAAVLQEPLKEGGSAAKLGPALDGGRQVAAKTGTTNSYADAWMVGFTPQYSTAVWTGDPRGGAAYPLTEFVQYGVWLSGGISGDGSTASGPLWKGVMNRIHEGLESKRFPAPSNSVGSAITARSVPDVVGLDVDHAITTLQKYGFVPKISTETAGDATILDKNIVVSQNPRGGGNGSHHQEITLTLSPGSDVGMKILTEEESKNEEGTKNE
ncbi:MAG: transglycosylase domain-containing protein [Enterococcus sp.]|nr:transglycosylase domain-containing protein [Enterococcus sp.]